MKATTTNFYDTPSTVKTPQKVSHTIKKPNSCVVSVETKTSSLSYPKATIN